MATTFPHPYMSLKGGRIQGFYTVLGEWLNSPHTNCCLTATKRVACLRTTIDKHAH